MTNRDSLLALAPTLLTRLGFDAMFSAVVLFAALEHNSIEPWKNIIFVPTLLIPRDKGLGLANYWFRYLGYFISLFCFGLGFIWIAFDPKKQGGA